MWLIVLVWAYRMKTKKKKWKEKPLISNKKNVKV